MMQSRRETFCAVERGWRGQEFLTLSLRWNCTRLPDSAPCAEYSAISLSVEFNAVLEGLDLTQAGRIVLRRLLLTVHVRALGKAGR